MTFLKIILYYARGYLTLYPTSEMSSCHLIGWIICNGRIALRSKNERQSQSDVLKVDYITFGHECGR